METNIRYSLLFILCLNIFLFYLKKYLIFII